MRVISCGSIEEQGMSQRAYFVEDTFRAGIDGLLVRVRTAEVFSLAETQVQWCQTLS